MLNSSDSEILEAGIDEAGRGCLFGPVCVAGVIWINEELNRDLQIKDSKKITIGEVEKMWGIGTPEDLDSFLEDYKEL